MYTEATILIERLEFIPHLEIRSNISDYSELQSHHDDNVVSSMETREP